MLVAKLRAIYTNCKIRELRKKAHIEEHVKILPGFQIGNVEKLIIHHHVSIGMDCFINALGGVEIHSGTILGPNVTIFSENHIYEKSECIPFANERRCKKVTIGENCWIGAHSFIVPGVTLGEGCIVAGGSVVTKDFPPLSVIGGAPAKIIKERDVLDYERAKSGGYCDWLLH